MLLELFFSLLLLLSSLFSFFPFCPPKSGITEKGVNKKILESASSPAFPGFWSGMEREAQSTGTTKLWIAGFAKSGLEMETLVN